MTLDLDALEKVARELKETTERVALGSGGEGIPNTHAFLAAGRAFQGAVSALVVLELVARTRKAEAELAQRRKGLDDLARLLMQEPWVTDEALEKLTWDHVGSAIEEPIKRAVCAARGHEVIPDQCNKPEHDWCVLCGDRFPGQADVPSRRKP